jgi:glucose-1-phosphate thymidylyltransferase
MRVIILAAGYGARMGDISKNTPKPLLPIAGKPILEHLFEKLNRIQEIDHIYIITNGKFYSAFQDWLHHFLPRQNRRIPITIINDGSTCNENRLGAIGDLNFLLESIPIEDSVLVTGGDNLYEFDLLKFHDFFIQKGNDCICVLPIKDETQLKRTGVVQMNADFQVIDFEEKPENPKSHWGAPPLYCLIPETLKFVKKYLAEGNHPDAPGHFIRWLYLQKPVFAFRAKGERFDVGNPETFLRINEIYSKRAANH